MKLNVQHLSQQSLSKSKLIEMWVQTRSGQVARKTTSSEGRNL